MPMWAWARSAGAARRLNGPYQAFALVAQRIAHLTTDLKVDPTNVLARIPADRGRVTRALQDDHQKRRRNQAAETSEKAANGASF
jgi:hypothetical protein